MSPDDRVDDLVARLSANAKLAPLARLVEACRNDDIDIDDSPDDWPGLDALELDPTEADLAAEAMRAITALIISDTVTALGAGLLPLSDLLPPAADTGVEEATAVGLLACAAVASEIRGGTGDQQRVVALLNMGLAQALVGHEGGVHDLTGVDRDWAVSEAGRRLANAAVSAAREVRASLRGEAPAITTRDVAGMVEEELRELLDLFPDVFEDFRQELSHVLEEFLEGL